MDPGFAVDHSNKVFYCSSSSCNCYSIQLISVSCRHSMLFNPDPVPSEGYVLLPTKYKENQYCNTSPHTENGVAQLLRMENLLGIKYIRQNNKQTEKKEKRKTS